MSPLAIRSLAVAGLLGLGLLSCGGELTGPESGRLGALTIAPRFPAILEMANSHGDVAPFVRVRITLNAEDGSIAKDTLIDFPLGVDSVALALLVRLPPGTGRDGAPMSLLLRYINATGDTIFRGGPSPVTVRPVGSAGASTPAEIPVIWVGTGANAASVTLTPATGIAVAGTTTLFTAIARDAQGAPIPGTPVVFSTPDPTGVQIASAGNPLITWLPRRGNARVVATLLTGQSATATFDISLPASQVLLVSGGAQSATIGTALASPVVFRVAASDGIGVAGVPVTFAVTTGGGTLGAATATSDANGLVSTTWTLGSVVGAQSITATATGIAGATRVATATGLAPVSTQLAFTTAPTTAAAGASLGAVTVAVRDAGGALTPLFTGPVTIALNAGATGAVLSGTSTVNAVAGVATFSTLSVNLVGAGFTLTATSGALTAATSASFAVTAGAASAMVNISGTGQSGLVGAALSAPFVVRVNDAFGNPVPGAAVTWVVTIGGGTVNAPTGTSDAAGLVSTTLTLPTAAGAVTVEARATGLTGTPRLFTATATAGAAASVALAPTASGNAQSAPINTALGLPLRAYVADAFGNPVAGVTVSWAVTGGTATVGAASSVSDAAGIATTTATMGTIVGAVTIAASATGLTGSPVGFTATVRSGPAAALVLIASPGPAAAGIALPSGVIDARDASNNLATTFVGLITVAIDSGPVVTTLSGTLARTAVAGSATFADLIVTTAGGYRLRFTSPGLTPVVSVTFNVAPGAATSIVVVSGDGQTGVSAQPLADSLVARVVDANANPVSGVTVNWAAVAGGGSITPASVVSDAAGRVAARRILGATGANTTTVSATGLTSATFTSTATAPAAFNWTGAAGTSWTNPANWAEGSVPSGADSVFIGAGAVNMPVIAAPITVRSLVSVNASPIVSSGVNISISQRLRLRTDVVGANCGGGNFILFAIPAPTPGAVEGRMRCAVRVEQGTFTLSDSLVLEGGNFVRIVNSARLVVGGRRLRTDGGLVVEGTGVLQMTTPSDTVIAETAQFNGSGTAGTLTAGELRLSEFFQAGSGVDAFAASGTHRTVFVPFASDTALVRFVAPSTSRFAQLELRRPIRMDGRAGVTGNVVLTVGGAVVGATGRLAVTGGWFASIGTITRINAVELAGVLSDSAGFSPDTAIFTGTGQLIPFYFPAGINPQFRSIRVAAGATTTAIVQPAARQVMTGDLIVAGEFLMNEPTAPRAIEVQRDLQVLGAGRFRLGGNYSDVRVGRDAIFGGAESVNDLGSGELMVGRDLIQLSTTSPRSLRTAPTFPVWFSGSGVVSFASPTESWFGEMRFFNAGITRTLISDATVLGLIDLGQTNTILQSNLLGAGGARYLSSGRVEAFGSPVTLRNVGLRTGTLDFDGNMFLTDFDPTAIQIDITNTTATSYLATVDFQTLPSGAGRYLRVTDPNGATDGFTAVSASGITPLFHSGFVELVRGATLSGWPFGPAFEWTGAINSLWNTPGNWAAGVVPTVTDSVYIPFAFTSFPNLPFGGVTVRAFVSEYTGGTLNLSSVLTVTERFNVPISSGVGCDGGGVDFAAGANPLLAEGQINSCPVRILSGVVTTSSDLSVSNGGTLLVSGSATLDVGAFLVVADGSFSTIENGRLQMQDGSGLMVVRGDALFGGGSTAGLLTAGNLRVEGNFTQSGDPESFAASVVHFTTLGITVPATMTFANPGLGAGTSHFQSLLLDASQGATFTLGSDVYVTAGLGGGRIGGDIFTAPVQRTLRVGGANTGTISFTRVRLLVETGSTLDLGPLVFGAMADNVAQLEIIRPSGSVLLPSLSFSTVPQPATAGRYLRLVDSNPGDASPLAVTVTTATPSFHSGFAETVGGATLSGWPAGPSFVWTGALSGDWNTPGNWVGGVVPVATDSVYFPGSFTSSPSLPAGGVTVRAFVSDFVSGFITLDNPLTVTERFVVPSSAALICGGGELRLAAGATPLIAGGQVANCPVRVLSGTVSPAVAGGLLVSGLSGSLQVEGTAVLDLGAGSVSVIGSFSTSGGGVLRMTNVLGSLDVSGNATFGGGSTDGLMTAGSLRLFANFVQSGNPSAFAPSGTHNTRFQGSVSQFVTFANPGLGAGTSHFHRLETNPAGIGSLVLNSDLFATAALVVANGGNITAATQRTLRSGGSDVSGITFTRVRWVLGDGAPVTTTVGIAFDVMANNIPQFEIVRPSGSLLLDGLSFATVPQPATAGRYLRLEDTNAADASTLTAVVVSPTPTYHGGFAETVNGAQLIGWSAQAPSPVMTWTGAGGNTLWSNSANWSLGRLPLPSDSVIINLPGGYTVTANTAATVKYLFVGGAGTPTFDHGAGATLQVDSAAIFAVGSTLNLTGGSLQGAGPVLLSGTFNWNGGAMRGASLTQVNAGATATIGTTAGGVLDERVLAIAGTAFLDGVALSDLNNPSIVVLLGGLLEFRQPTSYFLSGAPEIINQGTLRKRAAAGTVRLDWPLTNTGTIDVEAGLLDLRGEFIHALGTTIVRTGGTLSSGGHSAISSAIQLSAGGTLALNAIGVGDKEHILSAFSSVTGAGTVDVNGATLVDVAGTFDVGTLLLANATLEFNGADTAFVTNGAYSGGGFLRGIGVLGIRGAFSSTGGNVNGTGTIAVRPGGTLTFQSPLRGWRLDVAGTVIWGDWDLSLEADPISLQRPFINIRSGGLLNIQQGATARRMFGSALESLTVASGGTIRKSTGSATTTISPPLFHSGVMDVLSGTVFMQLGCTVTGGTFTGPGTVLGCP